MTDNFLTAFIVLVGPDGVAITDTIMLDDERVSVVDFLPVTERPSTQTIEHAVFQLTEQMRAKKIAEETVKCQMAMMEQIKEKSRIIQPR
jgi:hypothetical protein